MRKRPPVIGIPCDHRMVGSHPFHMVGEKYIASLRQATGAVPMLIPVLADPIPSVEILANVDGLLFAGSYSNVAPRLYGGTAPRHGVLQDEYRDATTLPLMEAAIDAGMPILCICRGFQELIVMLGGTLHQHLEEVAGRADHRCSVWITNPLQSLRMWHIGGVMHGMHGLPIGGIAVVMPIR